MTSKHRISTSSSAVSKKPQRITIDLQYLNAAQAQQLIKMFDDPEAYAENFSALKAITKGLYKIILESKPDPDSPLPRMFHTVNNLQGILLLDDMQEVDRITRNSGLMPYVGFGDRSQKGAGDE
jgi:hypothetical protein